MRNRIILWKLVLNEFIRKISEMDAQEPMGICYSIENLKSLGIITRDEAELLNCILYDHGILKPRRYTHFGEEVPGDIFLLYIWHPLDRESRINWLKSQIQEP